MFRERLESQPDLTLSQSNHTSRQVSVTPQLRLTDLAVAGGASMLRCMQSTLTQSRTKGQAVLRVSNNMSNKKKDLLSGIAATSSRLINLLQKNLRWKV